MRDGIPTLKYGSHVVRNGVNKKITNGADRALHRLIVLEVQLEYLPQTETQIYFFHVRLSGCESSNQAVRFKILDSTAKQTLPHCRLPSPESTRSKKCSVKLRQIAPCATRQGLAERLKVESVDVLQEKIILEHSVQVRRKQSIKRLTIP
jgi:hypothetical protein